MGYGRGLLGVILGGSWVVISGVVSPLVWVLSGVTLLIAPLISTHEPPSRVCWIQGLVMTLSKPGPRQQFGLGICCDPSVSNMKARGVFGYVPTPKPLTPRPSQPPKRKVCINFLGGDCEQAPSTQAANSHATSGFKPSAV